VATYLAALDQLFDEQANLLREQTHRAEQAELTVRLQQIRAAQAEARAAAAVSSEAVAQESLRQARDRRMQEWTQSGTPVPAIGEGHVLLGTPVIGRGPLFGNTQAPPENPGSSAAAVEGDAAAQPLTDGNPEDGEQGLPTSPPRKKARLTSKIIDAVLVMYPPSLFCLRRALRHDPGQVVRDLVLPPSCTPLQ
jgi:hypothetical protein